MLALPSSSDSDSEQDIKQALKPNKIVEDSSESDHNEQNDSEYGEDE